jgi:peptide/nickel transport system ATP-binding protein
MLSTDPSHRRVVRSGPTSTGTTPANPTLGCVYAARCPLVQDLCRQTPPPDVTVEDGTIVRCHFV